MQTVVALYDRFEDARRALDALKEHGFSGDRISLVANDKNSEYANYLQNVDTSQDQQDISDGAAAGAGIGAALGGLTGLLVGLGALAIPGIGPVLAAGPLISALAGAGIGAAAGGLVGALVDLGIPDEHAHAYAEGIRRGGTLVVLQTEENMTPRATQILNSYSPVDIESRMSNWRQDNWSGFDETASAYQGEMSSTNIPVTGQTMDQDMTMDRDFTTDTEHEFHDEMSSEIPVTGRDMDSDTTIPVIEEDIDIGKREVDRGGMRISSHIEEEPVDEEVHLRNERINVDRRPVDRPATDADFKEGSVEFRERGEEAYVNKQARVTEEIHVSKDVDETVEHIHDSVKRTVVDIDNIDMQDFQGYESGYRQHFQTRYGSMGQRYNYDDYMPAYRYGYALGNDNRYRSADWTEVERVARQDWERGSYNTPWDDARDAIRHGWESIRRRM